MKITITLEVYDEYVDETDETGVTSEGFDRIWNALSKIGDDIDIKKESTR